MRINNNLMAMNTYRQLGINSGSGAKSIEKLSSGLRINRAGDDAAGLAISEKMRGQIRGLNQASRNSQDAISLVQTAEGALNETQAILQRMRELAVQSANDTNEGEDRTSIQTEMDQLTSEINRISETTEFNKKKLLDGSLSSSADEKAISTSAGNVAVLNGIASTDDITIGDSVTNGKYEVSVVNDIEQRLADGQSETVTGAGTVTVSEKTAGDLDLVEGSYEVVIETTANAKSVSAGASDEVAGSTALLAGGSNDISVDATSDLAAGVHEVHIKKHEVVSMTAIETGGLSNISNTDATEGTYSISTAAAVTATDTGTVLDAAIQNVTIEADSTYDNADGYKLEVIQSGTGAGVTGSGTYDNTVDFTAGASNEITIGGVAVDITGLGNGSGTPAIGATETALQAAISAVFDGDSNGGKTYTVSNDGTNLTIVANDTNDTVVLGGDAAALTGLGLDTTNAVAAAYDTADNVEMEFRLVDTTNGNKIDTTTAQFTNSAGSTSIKVGDVSFDVDNALMYASDAAPTDGVAGSTHAGESITLTIANELTATQVATGETVTATPVADGAGSTTVTFDFTGPGQDGSTFSIDVDDDQGGANQEFVRGNTYNTTLSYTDTYEVSLVADGGATPAIGAGDFIFTEDDLGSTPGIVNNIAVGTANNGVLVDLDATALAGAADGDFSVNFTVASGSETTATLKSADGLTSYGSTVIPDAAGTAEFGSTNVQINYDADIDGESGSIYFAVKDTPDNLKMSLSLDSDNNGSYETTVVDSQAFEAGDEVTLGASGVKVQTEATIADSDTSTFTVEDGTGDQSVKMQIGANTGQNISIGIDDMGANALGVTALDGSSTTVVTVDGDSYTANFKDTSDVEADGAAQYSLDISSHENATAAIEVINNALTIISDERGKLGSVQNRLEHTIKNLDTSAENLQASESRIRDVDMAKEMMEFTKNNILSQAAQSMLAQANQAPQGVLQLLR